MIKKSKEKANKGITLIALVITIIVLLILAGISIATLTGENGVLTNLSDADIKNILNNKEYVEWAKETSFISKKGKHEIPYSDLYTGTKGNQPLIPEGLYHAGGTIDEGFVISDVQGDDLDNSKHGNQFVWVPVPNIDDFRTIKSYYDDSLQEVNGVYFEPSQKEYRYDKEEADYNAMRKSVQDNGGFYIGRFKAGNDGSDNVIVQKNATAYTDIPWETSMTNITGGAVEKVKNFVKKTYTDKGKTVGVTSTLVYGVQWDATMQFMDNNYIKEDINECAEDSYVRNSAEKGWYSDNYSTGNPNHKTGIDVDSNKSNCVKNIYDMAGNV